MTDNLLDALVVLVFILLGAVFVSAEIALVSLRDSQARALASRGRRGRIVSELNSDPNRFLAAAQVGVTLCGFLSAALGGEAFAGKLRPHLRDWGVPNGIAGPLALLLVTIVVSYVSLVIGELAPKRLALQRTESMALALGPMIDRISKVARPFVWLLSVSTDAVVRLLGGDPKAQREEISEAEIRELVGATETLGEEERRIVEDVFDAGDRLIREVMVPRTEVDFLDGDLPVHKAVREVLAKPHSRYPVVDGSPDDVIGFVHIRDLLDADTTGRNTRLSDLARDCLVLPSTRPLLSALTDLRREKAHLAIVADEYGGTAGIVTMEDLVEQLVGDIRDEYDVETETTRHTSGDVEVDGLLNLTDFEEETGIELPEGPYETVGGFLMAELGRIAEVGDTAEHAGRILTVTALDGRRVSRVHVTAPRPGAGETGSEADASA